MSIALTLTDPLRVVLLAPASMPLTTMAASVLERFLRLAPDQALARLQRAPGALAGGLSPHQAMRLATLLSVLGLRVRAEPDTVAPRPTRFDVSLQAASGSDLGLLARALVATTGRSEASILQDLRFPGGVILRAPDDDMVEKLRRQLRKLKGLQLAICCPDAAEFDLFLRPGQCPDRPLLRHLALLGLKPCRFSGALASGLNRQLLRHLTTRFGTRVFGLERAFQRLDLYLTGQGTVAPLDLADFLATRHLGGGRLDTISLVAPLRIETGLSYAAARQFQIDYEMIGLSTVARLAKPGRADENP